MRSFSREVLAVALAAMGTFLVLGCGGGFGGAEGSSGGGLFGTAPEPEPTIDEVRATLERSDPNELSPRQALDLLFELKKLV